MSTLIELAGFVAITLAAYEWSGRALALFVGGLLLWFVAQGLGGVELPIRRITLAAGLRLAAWRAQRKRAS